MKKQTIAEMTDADAEKIDLDSALAELEREIAIRARCYDRWIAERKLAYIDGRDRYLRLLKAIQILQAAADAQETTSISDPNAVDETPF